MKISVDIQKMDRYFPLEYNQEGGLVYDLQIDRSIYDTIQETLNRYEIDDQATLHECGFIILWIQNYIGTGSQKGRANEKFKKMWQELDLLQDYLLKHRITSIILKGETARAQPGNDLSIEEEINIDRVCDGLRSVFREEFGIDKATRRTRGLTTWRRRKLIKVKNQFLNYFSTIPSLDKLSLEEQSDLVNKLIDLAHQ